MKQNDHLLSVHHRRRVVSGNGSTASSLTNSTAVTPVVVVEELEEACSKYSERQSFQELSFATAIPPQASVHNHTAMPFAVSSGDPPNPHNQSIGSKVHLSDGMATLEEQGEQEDEQEGGEEDVPFPRMAADESARTSVCRKQECTPYRLRSV